MDTSTIVFYLILLLVVTFVTISLLRRWRAKQRLEGAKKEGLLWLSQGKPPYSASRYKLVCNTLAKARYDEEAAEILSKVSRLPSDAS